MREFLTRMLPGGLGGLNSSGSPRLILDTDLVDMDNLSYFNDTWAKSGGADKINTTALAGGVTITGYHEWAVTPGTVELVASTSDGKLVTIGPGGIVKTLKTGIGTNRVGVFAEGSTTGTRQLFFANGSTNLLVYEGGASAVVVGAPAADWATTPPTWIVAHNGRLWAGNDSPRIYGSLLLHHADFTGTGNQTFNVYPGEGEGIVGAVSKWGRLFLFKYPLGIYYLDDSNADPDLWTTPRHGRNVGSIGHRSIVEAAEDVLFVSPDGYIHALSAVQEFGEVKSSAILPMQLSPFFKKNVDFSRARNVQSVYFGSKRKVYWCFTRKGSSVNDLIVGLDFHNPGAVQAFISRRDTCEAMGIYTDQTTKDQYPAAGDNAGFLWKLETDTYEKDGMPYNGFWETHDIPLFEGGQQNANLKELEVEFNVDGNWIVDVKVIVDGVYRETKTFSSQGNGAVLGAFVLGSDVLGLRTVQNLRGRLHGDGRRVRLSGENRRPGESFEIVSQTIKFLPGNTR